METPSTPSISDDKTDIKITLDVCSNLSSSIIKHLYQISALTTIRMQTFENICGKTRKCWKPAFSPFPTMFSAYSNANTIISAVFDLSSAIAFNLELCNILTSGKEFSLFPNNERPREVQSLMKTFVEKV